MDEQNNIPVQDTAEPTPVSPEPVKAPEPVKVEPEIASVQEQQKPVEPARPAGFTPKPKEEPVNAEPVEAAPAVPETAAPKISWKKPLITMAIIGVAAIAAMLLLK